jgi:hypothetical protein
MYNGICWILLICLILGFLGWCPICWRWCKNKKEEPLLGPKKEKDELLSTP